MPAGGTPTRGRGTARVTRPAAPAALRPAPEAAASIADDPAKLKSVNTANGAKQMTIMPSMYGQIAGSQIELTDRSPSVRNRKGSS